MTHKKTKLDKCWSNGRNTRQKKELLTSCFRDGARSQLPTLNHTGVVKRLQTASWSRQRAAEAQREKDSERVRGHISWGEAGKTETLLSARTQWVDWTEIMSLCCNQHSERHTITRQGQTSSHVHPPAPNQTNRPQLGYNSHANTSTAKAMTESLTQLRPCTRYVYSWKCLWRTGPERQTGTVLSVS